MVETDFRSNKSKDPIKKLTFSRIKGVRKKEKPHIRWIDCIETYLKLLNANRRQIIVTDRSYGRNCLTQSRSSTGCNTFEEEEIPKFRTMVRFDEWTTTKGIFFRFY